MACRSDSTIRQDPSCLHRVLPQFVTEAQGITAVFVAHNLHNNSVSMTIEFIARSDQAKRDFPLLAVGDDDVVCNACSRPAKEYDITQFGQCDHLICNKCLDDDHRTLRLYDGSPCCCHPGCMKELKKKESSPKPPTSATKKAKKKSMTQGEGSLNSSSEEGCLLVMVYYKLILQDKDGCKIVIDKKKDRLSDTRMEDLVCEASRLLGQFDGYEEDDRHRGLWFYAACNTAFNRNLLTKYKSTEMAQQKLGKIVGQADRLYLVLDMTTGKKKNK